MEYFPLYGCFVEKVRSVIFFYFFPYCGTKVMKQINICIISLKPLELLVEISFHIFLT